MQTGLGWGFFSAALTLRRLRTYPGRYSDKVSDLSEGIFRVVFVWFRGPAFENELARNQTTKSPEPGMTKDTKAQKVNYD